MDTIPFKNECVSEPVSESTVLFGTGAQLGTFGTAEKLRAIESGLRIVGILRRELGFMKNKIVAKEERIRATLRLGDENDVESLEFLQRATRNWWR